MKPYCPHVDVEKDDPVKFAEKAASFGFKGITALWMANGRIIAEEESVSQGIRSLQWCRAAGISNMHTGDGMKDEGMDDYDAFKALKDRLLRIIEEAEKNKVIVDIEPHGTFSLSGKGLKRILSISDSPYFGINYDAADIYRSFFIENIQGSGFRKGGSGFGEGQGDDELEVLKEIAPRVTFYHAKDIKDGICRVLGEGGVKNRECIGVLKEIGYQGAISLETDGSNDKKTEIEMAKKSIKYLRSCMG